METSRHEEEQLKNGDTDSPSERSFLLPTALVVRSLSSESQYASLGGPATPSCSPAAADKESTRLRKRPRKLQGYVGLSAERRPGNVVAV
ncbi:hypothetical protein Naga_100580g2 [Nannochloropsis gaditana]|uniref:Uncharacterized protein n=1 Tax=Nannochloropsis gaditana TaxID=72520 RepID=W7U1G7_9STRA|nr:hypothetical protein Naga_100580g2 [Nannochloropsis gaditana]